jgi:hypothetical protein
MESLLKLLETLNSMSPLGVIALLGVIIWMLVKQRKGQVEIATNHLHDLPEVVELLRRMDERMERDNRAVLESLAYIRARINGGSR